MRTGTGLVPLVHNLEVVGYHDLAGRPAFKLAIQKVDERWYLYVGHLWHRGWSILDVTEPARPELLSFIAGPANTWTIQMQVAGSGMVTGLERIAPGWGDEPGAPFGEGLIIWDVSEPASPVELGRWQTGSTGSHRNFYDGGNLVHVAGAAPGLHRKIYRIVDVSEPTSPREVGRFWLPEQEREDSDSWILCHGPPTVEDGFAWLSYGEGGALIVDVSNLSRPELVSRLDFKGITNHHGIHTYLPIPRRQLAFVNDEAINEDGNERLNLAGIVDVADPTDPRLILMFPQPVPPPETRVRNFFEKGGRFGPHNHHHPNHHPDHQDRDDLAYLTYFNAGLRVFDVRDARNPQEIAWFLPPDPRATTGPKPTKPVAQSEDVLVDARGYIYVSHKSQGVWIMRLREVPN